MNNISTKKAISISSDENKKVKHPHGGHRQRLKDKVRQADLNILSNHEKIELLLTYTIPYKDTNPIAHEIMEIYGTLDKAIDADYYDLQKIKGVGEETALFFKVLSNLFDAYIMSKDADKNYTIVNTLDGVRYFRKHYSIKQTESFLIIGLSKTHKIVCTRMIQGADDASINIDLKRLTDILSMDGVYSIFIIHTHPNGDPNPSKEDILATERIFNVCSALNINLDEHVIISENNHYSFGHNGLLDQIERKFYVNANIIKPIIRSNKPKIPIDED